MAWRFIDAKKAIKVIQNKKILVADITISDEMWKHFNNFFYSNKMGILDPMPFGPAGHAVAIYGYEDGLDREGILVQTPHWIGKNSWG
jgi:C1A family cysteine protease